MIKLAFKKCFYNNWFDGWYGFLIAVRTFSIYSHVEIVLPSGLSFSSSENDGGVRYKEIKYSHPERWDFIEVPLEYINKEYNKITDEKDPRYGIQFKTEDDFESHVIKMHGKYDWTAIVFSEGIPLGIENPEEWYCSEICSFCMAFIKFHIGPGLFRKQIIKKLKK